MCVYVCVCVCGFHSNLMYVPVWPERLQVFSPGDERRRVSVYHTSKGDVLPSISHDLGGLH